MDGEQKRPGRPEQRTRLLLPPDARLTRVLEIIYRAQVFGHQIACLRQGAVTADHLFVSLTPRDMLELFRMYEYVYRNSYYELIRDDAAFDTPLHQLPIAYFALFVRGHRTIGICKNLLQQRLKHLAEWGFLRQTTYRQAAQPELLQNVSAATLRQTAYEVETALVTLRHPVPLSASPEAARTFAVPWCSYCAEGRAAEAGYALDVRGLFEKLRATSEPWKAASLLLPALAADLRTRLLQCGARPGGPAALVRQRRAVLPQILLETFDPGVGESGWARIHELVERARAPDQRPRKCELGALVQALGERGTAPVEFQTLGGQLGSAAGVSGEEQTGSALSAQPPERLLGWALYLKLFRQAPQLLAGRYLLDGLRIDPDVPLAGPRGANLGSLAAGFCGARAGDAKKDVVAPARSRHRAEQLRAAPALAEVVKAHFGK